MAKKKRKGDDRKVKRAHEFRAGYCDECDCYHVVMGRKDRVLMANLPREEAAQLARMLLDNDKTGSLLTSKGLH